MNVTTERAEDRTMYRLFRLRVDIFGMHTQKLRTNKTTGSESIYSWLKKI